MFHALLFISAAVAQPQPPARPALVSATADHLALHVSDLDRSVAFYSGYFGLKPMAATGGINDVRWLQAGVFEVHLIAGRTKPVTVPIGVHFALRVQDLNAFIGKLNADGIAWSNWDKKPKVTQTRPDGVRQLYLQDPDGYWIEVNERPKGAS